MVTGRISPRCSATVEVVRRPRRFLECGGKRSAPPLWLAAEQCLAQAKSRLLGTLRSADAFQNTAVAASPPCAALMQSLNQSAFLVRPRSGVEPSVPDRQTARTA